ncbi:hypothetical protein J2Z31_001287 [Sinorhizobium kostiense]|uniref:Uncharacterized protein n=1 Tax=Sinorhizobium kostiense TaxID=76747 RepID=A0ABS4QYY7_9HYPH|nr:hypothetical protein [Sinorhizobium kostiense]MBP2234797.1 hypothetical protein [Sinorhizobium kostiense]
MADYTVTCNGAEPDAGGVLYTVVVYYDGESFYSYVSSESDVASAQNVRTALYEQPVWFTDIWRAPSSPLFVCDADGQVHLFRAEAWTAIRVSERALNTVWGFTEALAYTGGDDGIVYRWDGSGWTAISPPLGGTILCIRGSTPTDLYVCGEDSLFWHYDGSAWTQIALPTNVVLVGLLPLSTADVLVSGQGGALFRGAGAVWTDVSQPGRDFYKMALFRGEIHIAGGGDGVLVFDGVSVRSIKDNIVVYRLGANETYLAAAGGNLAARFDGAGWFGARYT